MHEVLMAAISSKENEKGSESILQVNKNLSETIAQVEMKNQLLNAKMIHLKAFKRAFKCSESIQCKNCQVFYSGERFLEHNKTCKNDSTGSRCHIFGLPLQVIIQQTRINMDTQDNR